jgi:uncharacterized membrane protein
MLGFILTINVAIRMVSATLFVIVENSNPWQAICKSFEITKNNALLLFGLSLINLLALLFGILTFGIGMLWVAPFNYISWAEAYKRLTK